MSYRMRNYPTCYKSEFEKSEGNIVVGESIMHITRIKELNSFSGPGDFY